MPAISGVLVVEAVKQVYATTTGKRVRRSMLRVAGLPWCHSLRASKLPPIHRICLHFPGPRL